MQFLAESADRERRRIRVLPEDGHMQTGRVKRSSPTSHIHALLALALIGWFTGSLETALAAGSLPKAMPTENPACVQSYGKACSEAIGTWLPNYLFQYDADPWQTGRATHIAKRDGFVYENEKLPPAQFLGVEGPFDGTFFVHGDAGPPRGRVVYDYVHRIALYEQGCCAADEVVAALGAPPPPKRVISKDLSGLRTVRGIRFGITPAAVIAIYGKAPLQPIAYHPDLRLLAYTTWPASNTHWAHSPCGQMENFVFRHGRLAFIQFGNGC
ncbi:MAG: hypothetical protein ACREM2_00140 [Vulcanimicrobiaceae bacterium]